MVTARAKISTARQGHLFGALPPKVQVRGAVLMMEQTAQRLRKSFGLEGEVA